MGLGGREAVLALMIAAVASLSGAVAVERVHAQDHMSVLVTLSSDEYAFDGGSLHLQGDVFVSGYDPGAGHLFQEVRNAQTDQVLSRGKVLLRDLSDDTWVSNVGVLMIADKYPLGDYYVVVVTESGIESNHEAFSIVESVTSSRDSTSRSMPPPNPPARDPPAPAPDPPSTAGPSASTWSQ